MPSFLTHPLALRGLYLAAMAKAFLRYRNPRRRAVGRAEVGFHDRIWREAAEELGGSWVGLTDGIGEIDIGGNKTRVFENVTAIDDPVTVAVLHDKQLTHRLLREEGLPGPAARRFHVQRPRPRPDVPRCLRGRLRRQTGRRDGRRPRRHHRGPTRSHLARAAATAAVYGDELLIEEQIEGENYRLLYVDGELIDAFVRRHPFVVADGRSTVRKLVRRANDERVKAGAGVSKSLLTVDLDMRRTLAKQGLSFRSVPPAGANVKLKTVVNENRGVDNSTATDLLGRGLVEEGARAVRALRVRFAGLDVITRDPSVPLAESGGAVIEVNGTPNLYYHYHKQDGAFPVAVHLLRRLLLEQPAEVAV